MLALVIEIYILVPKSGISRKQSAKQIGNGFPDWMTPVLDVTVPKA